MARQQPHPAEPQLRGAIYQLKKWEGRTPPPEVLSSVLTQVVDALQLVVETDPLVKRVGMIILMLQLSTSMTIRNVRGKEIRRLRIDDLKMYTDAFEHLHNLPLRAAA